MITVTCPFDNDTVTNSYNSRLRMALSLQQPTGAWTNGFGYDVAKRLTNVTSQAGSFGYLYPASSGQHLVSSIGLPNSSYITNTYDSVARLTGTYLKNSRHLTVNSHEYAYNAGNQRTQQVFRAGSTYNYSYDGIGQLKVADSATASEDRGYAYDTAWNLNYLTNNGVLGTFRVDNKNQLTNAPAPDTTLTYDDNGNLTGSTLLPYYYDYDDENRLIQRVIYYGGAGPSEGDDLTTFAYDGIGRLRRRVEYTFDGVDWVVTSQVRYIYDGWRVIQERDGSNTPTVSYTRGTDLSGSLEGAGGIGGLLARSHGYSSGNWSTNNFYHADGNGNITYLVDSSQFLAASYRYDPYGNLISSSGTLASANVYRFSSKEFYDQTGSLPMYYYGYRWYLPKLQRWLNRDPITDAAFKLMRPDEAISTVRDEINPYAAFADNPVLDVDPWGLKPSPSTIDKCKKEKAVCIGAVGASCGVLCALACENPLCLLICAAAGATYCEIQYRNCLRGL